MRYFNYEKAAREGNIPPDKLADLCKMVREEFPQDDMLYELHVLRHPPTPAHQPPRVHT